MLRIIFLFHIYLLCNTILLAQTDTRTLRGRVVDIQTGNPIENAELELLNYLPPKTARTDKNGRFKMRGVPVGIHRILVRHEDYKSEILTEIEINDIIETMLEIPLRPNNLPLEDPLSPPQTEPPYLFVPKPYADNPKQLSHHEWIAPEVKKYSLGTYQDIERLVAQQPFTRLYNDRFNHFISKGKLQLQSKHIIGDINSLPLQHFATPYGGGMSILPLDAVRDVTVWTGGTITEYVHSPMAGNAIHLTAANRYHSKIGIELASTGLSLSYDIPLQKIKGSVLSIRYRQGVLNWLQHLPMFDYGIAPQYQDANFLLEFPETKSGGWRFWGIWGRSQSGQFSSDWLLKKHLPFEVDNHQAVAAIEWNRNINAKSYFHLTLLGDWKDNQVVVDSITSDNNLSYWSRQRQENWNGHLNFYYNNTWNRNNQVRLGLFANYHYLDYLTDWRFSFPSVDFEGDFVDIQAYFQSHSYFGKKLQANIGLIFYYYEINRQAGISPRLSLRYELNEKNHVSAQYVVNQQVMPWHIYLQQDINGVLYQQNLRFSNNHILGIDYESHFHHDWRTKLSIYGHYSDKILSYQNRNRVFILENIDLLNYQEQMPRLQNQGTALRWGAAWSMEKFWSDGWLAKFHATYGDGFYRINGANYAGRYIHLYNTNLQLSKEWSFGKRQQTGISFHTNLSLGDGFRYTPIELTASANTGQEQLDYEVYMQEKTPIHWRWDAKVGFRANGDNMKHSFWIECNNLLNRQNISAYSFAPHTTTVEAWTGLRRVWNFSYKMIIEPKKVRS